MSEEGNEPTKYQKVKRHLKDNRKVYLAAGGGIVVGAAGMFIVCGGPSQMVDSLKLIHIQYKSPNVNVALVKHACPDPIPVRDKLTGESYRSLNRAAKVTGDTIRNISADAQGAQERFESLPNDVFA